MLKLGAPKGQAIIEYALILVLVVMAVVVVLSILGPTIGKAFSQVMSSI